MPGTIHFDLLGNGVDSIQYAIELLAWPGISRDERRIKQAILSTAQGVELLLKERLRLVQPALVFEDVDRFPSLDARTVGVERAITRLRNIGGVEISKADEQLLKDLRRTRNAIEHAEWHTTLGEAKAIIGPALSFALDFARTNLGRDLAYEFRRDDTWDQLLSELGEFATAHAKRLAALAGANASSLMTCEYCQQQTLISLERSCPVCGHWNNDPDSLPM